MIKFRTKTSSFSSNLILLFFLCLFFSPYIAFAGNITPTAYAWSSKLGWVNFSPSLGDVTVTDSALTGYAWFAQSGWLNLAPNQGGVKNNRGTLSGYAWGEGAGWINFSGVTINTSTGVFSGQATGDVVGTLNFSCSQCHVVTTWRSNSHRSGGFISLFDFSPNTNSSSSVYSFSPGTDVEFDNSSASSNGGEKTSENQNDNLGTPIPNSSSTPLSKISNFFGTFKFPTIFGYPVFSILASLLALVLLGWLVRFIVRRGSF